MFDSLIDEFDSLNFNTLSMSQSVESATTAITIEYVLTFNIKIWTLNKHHLSGQPDNKTRRYDRQLRYVYKFYQILIYLLILVSGLQLVKMPSKNRVSWPYPALQHPLQFSRIWSSLGSAISQSLTTRMLHLKTLAIIFFSRGSLALGNRVRRKPLGCWLSLMTVSSARRTHRIWPIYYRWTLRTWPHSRWWSRIIWNLHCWTSYRVSCGPIPLSPLWWLLDQLVS